MKVLIVIVMAVFIYCGPTLLDVKKAYEQGYGCGFQDGKHFYADSLKASEALKQ